MKKIYIAPLTEAENMSSEQMICTSPEAPQMISGNATGEAMDKDYDFDEENELW